jgi:hypothetical protein
VDDMRPEHHQVRIEHGSWSADVDQEIAPLILACWRAGIDTDNSCQENRPGIAWVEFPTAADAEHFTTNVVRDMDALYWRAFPNDDGEIHWEWAAVPEDLGEELDEPTDEIERIGPPDIRIVVGVRFPRSDIPLLTEKLSRPT